MAPEPELLCPSRGSDDEATMEPRRSWFLIAGGILLAVSVVFFVTSTGSTSSESTFLFGPGNLYRITVDLMAGTTIEGRFTETSSRPVNFQIMSSGQFADYQYGNSTAALYGIANVVSATISYVTTAPDTYNLVFTHGSGVNATQTVQFARTFRAQNIVSIVLGTTFTGLAAVDFYVAFRRSPPRRPVPAIPAPRHSPDAPAP